MKDLAERIAELELEVSNLRFKNSLLSARVANLEAKSRRTTIPFLPPKDEPPKPIEIWYGGSRGNRKNRSN